MVQPKIRNNTLENRTFLVIYDLLVNGQQVGWGGGWVSFGLVLHSTPIVVKLVFWGKRTKVKTKFIIF